jgi:hypothetical protein
MAETIVLKSGSRIVLAPAGGQWFDGNEYFGPDEHGWQLVDKGERVRGSGVAASREDAVRDATGLDRDASND